ncbi:MAG: bifunctional (p)ppGpp synthetase/guanosine-3',5'-bis(diphosphate) 3'-pyrophosphohydrolase [Ignavibacteria bacterium]|nr:bifunctional (p)ppGpp synthetase/guanosine-3',5'-bis(diphosphate) 3'-pyrophosphohydrolase [Ignavibacteria bacterium]
MLSNFYKKKLDELISVSKRTLGSEKVNDNLISNAFKFALEAHKNVNRASGEPYFLHPYEVAMIMAKEIPIDDVSIASALLHDVLEDSEFTIKDIKAEFGDEIAEIVEGASQIEGIFENYEVKVVDSFKKLLLSMASDLRIILVKFADRLHNLRTIEQLPPQRQTRIAQDTLEIFAPFAHRFGLSNIKAEMEDLSFKCLNRSVYDEIAMQLREKKKERDKFLKNFIEPINEALKKENYKFEITSRVKHIYSIYRKMMRINKPIDEIYDLFAVRVILDTPNKYDCFSAYGIISQIYLPVPERFKDYISLPKQNGYQSIHTTVVSKEGKLVEVQIRTREMHEFAEKGIAAHWKYKENIRISDKKLDEWMKWIRETIENVGKEDVSSSQLFETFKLNLYQDEIYCFTPKGELKILPYGATPLDFAFEIHTEIGMRCIGAKVNGKIVSLDTPLKSGSQVEIITSKNQTPKKDWEKIVVTQKAKSDLRKYFNTERRKIISKGRDIFEKKLKKKKININEDELTRMVQKYRYKDLSNFYYSVGLDEIRADEMIGIILNKRKSVSVDNVPEVLPEVEFLPAELKQERLIKEIRESVGSITIGDSYDSNIIQGLKYDFAKCCNPIPGDEVVGYITRSEGLRIHRRNCNNIINLYLMDPNRIIDVNWNMNIHDTFAGGIIIIGEDRKGIVNEITEMISKNFGVNIKSININTKGSLFEGTIILEVKDLKQLNSIIEKISHHKSIIRASRFG